LPFAETAPGEETIDGVPVALFLDSYRASFVSASDECKRRHTPELQRCLTDNLA
jgi:hypothetical protein